MSDDDRDLDNGSEEEYDENEYGTDDDYGEQESEDIPEEQNMIDTGAEWRDFGDGDVSKSRVGAARPTDIQEDLGTRVDEAFQRIERITRTPEDIFRIMSRRICDKYNLAAGVFDDAQRILQLINSQNRKLKFKSPAAIVFAILCIVDGRISQDQLRTVYDTMAVHEKMTIADLLRYVFFVVDLRSNR